MGTERIEETILQIVPHAKVVRVDKDTLRKKIGYGRFLMIFVVAK